MSAIGTLSRESLRQDLADATLLVWKMQRLLCEDHGDSIIKSLEACSHLMRQRALVIEGTVARWAQAQKDGLDG